MTLATGTRLGPYEIVAPLGAGGMGEVYRARDTRLDRDVAIKVLPPDVAHDADRRARFEREARASPRFHIRVSWPSTTSAPRAIGCSSSPNCSRSKKRISDRPVTPVTMAADAPVQVVMNWRTEIGERGR